MSETGNKKQLQSKIEFKGIPQNLDAPQELSRWKKFLNWANPFFRAAKEDVRRIKEAGVDIVIAESEIKKAEAEQEKAIAAQFQAEAANEAAKADLKNMEVVKAVNDEFARIFSDESVPDSAKLLQLAQLTAKHPEILEQIEKIKSMMETLRVVNFTQISIEVTEEEPVPKQIEK